MNSQYSENLFIKNGDRFIEKDERSPVKY